MELETFKKIISSFADRQSSILLDKKGGLIIEIGDELIEAKLRLEKGAIYIMEDGAPEKEAAIWISERIAKLHVLADRIISNINSDDTFITPRGSLLDNIEENPNESEILVDNVVDTTLDLLDRSSINSSDVLYFTSDAGEGKTTLINHLAKIQARRFLAKKSSWLLLPIPLGGRPFLRFDDIVIASLVNRLRFRYFYYESFIELVKLGLIIPAFDGFEEMFVTGSTGEALSATGQLLSKLDSCGSIIISARKNFFEYNNFGAQAKIFDSIGKSNVNFAKISLNRWNKEQFIQFGKLKGVEDSEQIYNLLLQKLNNDTSHPLLTRAVLVNRLFEVLKNLNTREAIIEILKSPTEYFPNFVKTILTREIETKWIDTSGEPPRPLLNENQHYRLLSLLAEEMWINSTESLKENIIDLICDIFIESEKINVSLGIQIKERIKHHALITKSESELSAFKFDHEEFRQHFLGLSISKKIIENKIIDLRNVLRRGAIPDQSIEIIVIELSNTKTDIKRTNDFFIQLVKGEATSSFLRENSARILIRLLGVIQNEIPLTIENYYFPNNSLANKKISNIIFKNCYFLPTSLELSELKKIEFIDCSFDRLTYYDSTIIKQTSLNSSNTITSFHKKSADQTYFSPDQIQLQVRLCGFETNNTSNITLVPIDERLELTEKVLRKFLRTTSITDNIIRIRLSNKADNFIKEVLPILTQNGILQKEIFSGQGNKQCYRLGHQMTKITEALYKSEGDFARFISYFV